MDRKLVKEIVTTETEKFTEDGKIKERVKETREKIYSDPKEEVVEAAPSEEKIEEKPQKVEEKPKEKTQEELIREAAEAMDKKNAETNPYAQSTQPPGSYNVVSRTSPPPMGPYNPAGTTPGAKFPWEN